MTFTRGRANHSLYLARILLQGWRDALSARATPGNTLSQAYLPAVRLHLADAYGWFLLEITRPGEMPGSPPHSVTRLPDMADGKAVPGEVREFQQLEQEGWIGDMLAAGDAVAVAGRSADNLATSATPGPEDAARWADALQQLFDRMGDSLDEY